MQVATRVEVFVGLPPSAADPDPNNCVFKRLGYLSFDSNERSSHQARELKSVHVNVPALLIRLVIHRCHVNKLNIYNQASMAGPGGVGWGWGMQYTQWGGMEGGVRVREYGVAPPPSA